MALITLLGRSQAEEGREFYYLGPLNECRDCKLKGVCFNLEAGARYRVVEVRSQTHPCHEYMGDEVVAAVVEKIPTPAAVPKKMAIDGSMITYQESRCQNLGCGNYRLCHAPGKAEGSKYLVESVEGDMECPNGDKMVRVNLFRGPRLKLFRIFLRLSSRTCRCTAC